jgi:hypothetical protein
MGGSLFTAMTFYVGMDHIQKRDRKLKQEVGKDIVTLLREMEKMGWRLERLENAIGVSKGEDESQKDA